jgi:hypothetical protein
MTITYILLFLLQAGIIIYFVMRNRQARTAPPAVRDDNTYEEIRRVAINVTPGQLKLTIPAAETFVYGMVMDWNMGETIVTLAAYITGAANMYFSTGGGITGGGRNPDAGEAAVEFVIAAQAFIDRSVPTTITGLPAPGMVKFYLLTNRHIYAAQEQAEHFEDNSSPWLSLCEKGNQVMIEMRKEGNGLLTN